MLDPAAADVPLLAQLQLGQTALLAGPLNHPALLLPQEKRCIMNLSPEAVCRSTEMPDYNLERCVHSAPLLF